ncbi:MAG: MFS transporter [bacterium]|nr:MFS transporter [bacterium]
MKRDFLIILITAWFRAFAISLSGLIFGIYLAKEGLNPSSIGTLVTAGLAGGALATLIVTLIADSWGRKKVLIFLSIISAIGGILLPLNNQILFLGIISFLGMINGMGRDRGAALVIEQAILPTLAEDQKRTKWFAWYNVLQDAAHAIGALCAGLPTIFVIGFNWEEKFAYTFLFFLYASCFLVTAGLYSFLSEKVEIQKPKQSRVPVTKETKKHLMKISSLFALDSIGGGFLTSALLSYFFFKQFDATPAQIGVLYFLARIANAFSHLAAAFLAKRFGLVNTMVFTHIPSSFLLITVAFAPSFTIAAILFLIRESLVEMDVPTRQSYVMAIVKPEERTLASGVTHLVRLGAWAIGPAFAGLAMQSVSMLSPLFAGAGLKITYDLLLYFSFRKVKPPEEIQSH